MADTHAQTDLVAYARDAAARGDDLFALLAVDATAEEPDIRRAFRRKALTAHPDKAGDAYDPALYERLEKARDVLVHPESRQAYDDGMRAVLQKKVQLEQMSSRRRKLVEELERREHEAKRSRTDARQAAVERDAEREAMAARGRAKLEERRRLMREAEERERLARQQDGEEARAEPMAASSSATKPISRHDASSSTMPPPGQGGGEGGRGEGDPAADDAYDEKIAELERRIREKQQRKAEKKARKGGVPTPSAPPSEGGPPEQPQPPPVSSSSSHPPCTSTAETGASKLSSSAAPADANPPHTSADRYAATMARLKAAQAKRDEDKRKRAEEAKAPQG